MRKKVKIALLGLGNVGRGVWKILETNKEEVSERSGYDIEVAKILVRDVAKNRGFEVPEELLTSDPEEVFNDDSIRIIVEVMGGVDPAYDYMMRAIRSKKHVVTANKFAIATVGDELIAEARKNGVMLYYEASVAGGIPIINGLNESLTANKIEEIIGIINGTTNYILTKMTYENCSFESALKEAQDMGYAEADPTADVDAYDALYKIRILTSLGFGVNYDVDNIYREGIRNIQSVDIEYAKKFGYVIKLLGIAKENNGGLEIRVHPAMIPERHPLANVNDSFNAIFIKGNAIGDLMMYGRGAGDLPTGSSVVADIISILRKDIDNYTAPRAINVKKPLLLKSMDETETDYYIRLKIKDIPGVLGQVSTILGQHDVSISSMIQKGQGHEWVSLVFVTHKTLEGKLNTAMEEIKSLSFVEEVSNIIRVEKL
ncbi:homoserine dehydrogenase [Clostridium grantii]|uniref:homoserine dehydrogenase n=1 Tax=Clostridium grantii TaxID=40575 RepID=UPI0009350133|nr:homoserine dehydrogenase [Clostridium grantii]